MQPIMARAYYKRYGGSGGVGFVINFEFIMYATSISCRVCNHLIQGYSEASFVSKPAGLIIYVQSGMPYKISCPLYILALHRCLIPNRVLENTLEGFSIMYWLSVSYVVCNPRIWSVISAYDAVNIN